MAKGGLELTVAINLSLVSLDDTALADRVMQVVRSSGLGPGDVILEITETVAMTDVALPWRILPACGCGVLAFPLTTLELAFRVCGS